MTDKTCGLMHVGPCKQIPRACRFFRPSVGGCPQLRELHRTQESNSLPDGTQTFRPFSFQLYLHKLYGAVCSIPGCFTNLLCSYLCYWSKEIRYCCWRSSVASVIERVYLSIFELTRTMFSHSFSLLKSSIQPYSCRQLREVVSVCSTPPMRYAPSLICLCTITPLRAHGFLSIINMSPSA